MTMLAATILIAGLLAGVGLGWLAWGRPLKGATRVVGALTGELATARHAAPKAYSEGFCKGADLAEVRVANGIATRLAQLPPLACGRDPHLKLSEVLAVVRGEVPVVKRRKVKDVALGQNATGADPILARTLADTPAGPVYMLDPSTDRDAPDTGEVAA